MRTHKRTVYGYDRASAAEGHVPVGAPTGPSKGRRGDHLRKGPSSGEVEGGEFRLGRREV